MVAIIGMACPCYGFMPVDDNRNENGPISGPKRSQSQHSVCVSYDEITGMLTVSFLTGLTDVNIKVYHQGVVITEKFLASVTNGDSVSFTLDEDMDEVQITVTSEGNIVYEE